MTDHAAEYLDERAARLRRGRRWRRGLTVVFLLSTVTVLVAAFLDLEAGFIQNLIWVARFASPGAAIVLMFVVGFVPSRADEELDERLRSVRDRAHRYAYALLSVVVLSLLLVAFARAVWFDWIPDAEALTQWMLGMTMLALAAPSAVMAWSESVYRE